jgi:hypothetical protein
MAKGVRWSDGETRGGTRDAGRRNDTRRHPGERQEGSPPGRRLSTALQPGSVPSGLRPDLQEYRRDDPGIDRGDRGRDVNGEDPKYHRALAQRTLSMVPRPSHLHTEEERQTATARHSDVVRQAAARSHALHPGGLLRAAVQHRVARLPPGARMSHRHACHLQLLDLGEMARRG